MQRFEGQEDVYEVTQASPVLLGRLSVFFEARSIRSGENVLIKAFRDTTDENGSLQSLNREIKALRRLKHPHILEIIDYNLGAVTEAAPFLVVPFCAGGNLEQVRRRSDFLPLDRALPILRQIASAIDYAHANGVLHGDIKPQNILFNYNFEIAYLCDFGMAKYFDVTDRVRSTVELSTRARDEAPQGGTSAYLSPEQLTDNRQSTRSDIYSFGLVAYELLTGRLPFDVHQPLYKQLHARVTGALIDPSTANPNLSHVVQRGLRAALAVMPEARPLSATALCDMLMGIFPAGGHYQTGSKSSRLLWTWEGLDPAGRAGVITAIVTAIAGVVIALVKILPPLFGGR